MKKHTGNQQPRRDPMQWNRNERFAEEFSVARSEPLAPDELPPAFGAEESLTFVLDNGIRGSEQRLEMIRDISRRLQQNGSIRL
ncbi:hypothetical protein [Phytobacter sp. AG2a]